MPKPVVPAQDLTGWIAALQTLSEDRDFYAAESAAERAVAVRFIASIDPWQIEKYLDANPAGA
jgi:hypothetical protein